MTGKLGVVLAAAVTVRRVGGALPSLGDAIQRRANSIASDRDDSNSSLVH